jgi:hypothetical protein
MIMSCDHNIRRKVNLLQLRCECPSWSRRTAILVLIFFATASAPPFVTNAEEFGTDGASNIDICDLPENEVVARVGSEEICVADIKSQISDLMQRQQIKYPFSEQTNPMPSKASMPSILSATIFTEQEKPAISIADEKLIYRTVAPQLLKQDIEQKLVFNDAYRTVPKDAWAKLTSIVYEKFDKSEIPELLKTYEVTDQQALEQKLLAKGNSLIRIRKQYFEKMVAQGWMNEKINVKEFATEEEGAKKKHIQEKVDDYLAELHRNTAIWSICDSHPDKDFPPVDSLQMFPKTMRDDVFNGNKLPKIIP